jgi:hypothetical protein
MIILLDPTDERVPVQRALALRARELKGVVGLLDITKPRGNVLLDRIENRLRERLPGIEIRRYAKPTFTKPAPEALRLTIKKEVDAVIEALAD